MNPIDKVKSKTPVSLFVDNQTNTHKHQTVDQIILERLGKVEKHEIYFSSKEMLNMYPNGYSVLIKQTNSRKYVSITVFNGIGDVTSDFFRSKANRKVKGIFAVDFLDKIENLG